MHPIDFLLFSYENFNFFIFVNLVTVIFLYKLSKRFALGGALDPFHVAYTFTIGTKYASMITLYLFDYIAGELISIMAAFGVVFYISMVIGSRVRFKFLGNLAGLVYDKRREGWFLFVCWFVYFGASLYMLSNIGFGLFADTNRFDNNKGFGSLVRVSDLVGTFLITYSFVHLYKRKFELSCQSGFFIRVTGLAFFIIFFSALNGAKSALLLVLLSGFLAVHVYGRDFHVSSKSTLMVLLLGSVFILLALSINLERNSISAFEQGAISGRVNVVEKLAARVVANGNQTYMALPNNVIEEIKTDNLFIRLLTPLLGAGLTRSLIGYDPYQFSVGRQILLYFDADIDVAGGPTSHFDVFSYVSLGVSGVFFVAFLGCLVGAVFRLVKNAKGRSLVYVSLIVTLWVRSLTVVLEPPIGIAYFIDFFVVFVAIRIISLILAGQRVSN